MRKSNILFVGATVLDKIYTLDGSLLEGKKNKASVECQLGGGGFNAAIVAHSLTQIFPEARQVKVSLVTKIGGGQGTSKTARDFLKLHGLNVLDAIKSHERFNIPENTILSQAFNRTALIDGNAQYPNWDGYYGEDIEVLIRERSMPAEVEPGEHAEKLDQTFIDQLIAAIKDAAYVHIHMSMPDLSLLAAKIARHYNKPVIIDASHYDAHLDAAMALATHAFLADEIETPQGTGAKAVMTYIQSFPTIEHAAVFCGKEPTWYQCRGSDLVQIPVITTDEFRALSRLKKNGAGDATRGAVCVNLGQGTPVLHAIYHGGRMGTYSCARGLLGAVTALQQNSNDIDRFVGDFKKNPAPFEFSQKGPSMEIAA
ncbi:MAG: hypothetical protein L6Q57_02345 [Alphaproteobacteria bacterium]|nr:hypothetical protein [Alphaproteobacteria bacterium]